MATDLREQLQAGLGAGYAIERELGGGGMSRVFLARESALGRDVVVKVLSPELASGLSADRFRREIMLAATFQHPCIVPVLTAGQLDGLPFFTMPFVRGESLRAKLGQHGALPLADVYKILRDVASALAYAHERGVVHRDIKPDNVLLSGGYAVVTDFGIAKALSSARREGESSTLTSIGSSIGTPAYMAPEQAAGDPATDHRADLYALGCVAYELLAGRPPFEGRSPHKLLAAHMSESPAPVTDHRPETPALMAALIIRLLEKDPERRPGSAGEVLQALDTMGTPSGGEHAALPAISLATRRTLLRALAIYAVSFVLAAALARLAIVEIGLPDWVLPATLVVMALGLPVILFTAFVHHGTRMARTMATMTPGGSLSTSSTMHRIAVKASPHVSWRRTTWGGVMAVAGLILIVAGYMVLRALGIGPAGSLLAAGKIDAKERLLVADFQTSGTDSALGSVVAEAVRTNLGQSRAVTILPRSAVSAALRRMQRGTEGRLDLALAREVAQREGVRAVVHGEVLPLGPGFIVTVALMGAESGDELASFRETANAPGDLIPAIDRATRDLRRRMGESLKTVRESRSLAQVTTASLPALRKYTEGMYAHYTETDYVKSAALFEEAIRLDSSFAMAYRMAATAYGNTGLKVERRRWMLDRAFALRERLPELERNLVDVLRFGAADRERAIAAAQRVLEIDPSNSRTLNNLAIQFTDRREFARAESLYRRAIAIGDGNAQPQLNILEPLIAQGKLDEAQTQLARAREKFPLSISEVETDEVIFPYLKGQFDSAATLARHASTRYHDLYGNRAALALANIALLRGRVGEWRRLRSDFARRERERGDTTSLHQLPIDSAFTDIWFGTDTAAQSKRLELMLRWYPLDSIPLEQRPYLPIARAWAAVGRPDRARSILTLREQQLRDTIQLKTELPFRRYVEGEILLAEHRFPEAIAEMVAFDKMYDGYPHGCPICTWSGLGRAYDLAGQADSAVAVYERYINTLSTDRLFSPFLDGYFLAPTHRRLGELYENRGDPAAAVRHYESFVELWKNADPQLQPQVAEIRRRLNRLKTAERSKG